MGDINGRHKDEGPPRKKRKLPLGAEVTLQKNPVMALNEIRPNLVYEFTDTGPPHAKIYTASVMIDGKNYKAEGTTKKKAKACVAQMILQYGVQLKDPSVKPLPATPGEDFSEDPSEVLQSSVDFFWSETEVFHSVKSVPISTKVSQQETAQQELAMNNPVFNLNRLVPGLKIEIIKEEGSPHAMLYTARVIIDGHSYDGVGPSKKAARNEAAQNALVNAFCLEPPASLKAAFHPLPDAVDFGDYVSKLVEMTFKQTMKNEEPSLARYKVLAGIVMSRGPKAENAQVVALATGSKCISGGHLCLKGEALNDCHAEILARRGLVSFFYDQLEIYASNPTDSIFESSGDGHQQTSRLRLKSDTSFHLYISSAPCGDARIFALSDTLTSPFEDNHPLRQCRGALRTKIESGEGTVPVNRDQPVQTWDGILQGERLLTMSCSDKILRWNVVGVQGSLLTHLIDPIYFHTVVVGALFHPVHLKRALIGRIEHLQGLPSPFVFSRPILTSTSGLADRLPTKAPKHSICWAHGWPKHEMIEVHKGKLLDGSVSHLCKRSLFLRFASLTKKRPEWFSVIEPHVRNRVVFYSSLKEAARDFVEAKQQLQSSLTVARLGKWVKKPMEQDGFEIPFENEATAPNDQETADRPSPLQAGVPSTSLSCSFVTLVTEKP